MANGIAGRLIGLGSGSDGLQKLTITHRLHPVGTRTVRALFNPTEISRSRQVHWHQQATWQSGAVGPQGRPEQQFVSADPETLRINLFFDTYEPSATGGGLLESAARTMAEAVGVWPTPRPVTTYTEQVVQLSRIDPELHHPPICTLSWGSFAEIFVGVLVSVDQRFTMFLADGTPVRATLDCSFQEYRTTGQLNTSEPHSADVDKTRTVRRGDTLPGLAAQEYGDPAAWRHIARANALINPRTLTPGTVLRIPRLDG